MHMLQAVFGSSAKLLYNFYSVLFEPAVGRQAAGHILGKRTKTLLNALELFW